ncbi:DUF1217 domain-containing protein [Salipiger bermudensis]|uniref:DUF1217 domain-containing protein n=1 Tax=Salipiger bermudensis TaxID=344736 RepID=UPI001CD3AAED|nr:DUF1217 domain-containing protein [Salipiger bermudensis]MCA0962617.1 DUF1217 domain-containing protein [Salipiger bermudensis]
MTYTPMIGRPGLVGWQILQNTMETQRAAFNNTPGITREAAYFTDTIGSIGSAEDLVGNRRLLSVALTAFGMEEEIDSKYLVRRLIEEGTAGDDALANKLNDSRFVALADAFDFEPVISRKTQEEGFAEAILGRYEDRVRANLAQTLAEPDYVADPDYAALFAAQVEENLEISRAYFTEKIGLISSAEELLLDPELRQIATTAFELGDRANSTTVLRRALEENPAEPNALSNVLKDDNLRAFATAFAFYDTKTSTVLQTDSFASNITEQFRWQRFEDAVSEVDQAIGTALKFQRSVPELAANDLSETAKWYNVLGSTMMREVFETALSLPDGFSQIDLDKQVEVISDKARQRFGIETFSDLEDPKTLNGIVQSYLLQEQISQTGAYGSQQIALSLLGTIRYDRNRA